MMVYLFLESSLKAVFINSVSVILKHSPVTELHTTVNGAPIESNSAYNLIEASFSAAFYLSSLIPPPPTPLLLALN